MALAIRFDQLICDGVVADQAELARLGYVSRARITQIINLVYLAPDIQEKVLYLSASKHTFVDLTERQIREFTAMPCWKEQRDLWDSSFNHADLPKASKG
jgi:hypothetical protein